MPTWKKLEEIHVTYLLQDKKTRKKAPINVNPDDSAFKGNLAMLSYLKFELSRSQFWFESPGGNCTSKL